MSRKATALELDNVVIESFFNKIKVEIGSHKQFENTQQLMETIKQYRTYSGKITMPVIGIIPTNSIVTTNYLFQLFGYTASECFLTLFCGTEKRIEEFMVYIGYS